jgi:ATP/maltotriose-dependent transcriptional regulator MalT
LEALNQSKPSKALEFLQAAVPYELAVPGVHFFGFFGSFYPVYIRAQAYLDLHQGAEAGQEFEKILRHRGLAAADPVGALAQLGLARSYALQGDTAKAKAVYQDFLTLWKQADPEIPILKQAKAEYAKLP